MVNNGIYEIETRFTFQDENEAFKTLPFIKNSFTRKITWQTYHYGIELFKKDIILRITKGQMEQREKIYLGYKNSDCSTSKLNIRKEYEEDITNGVDNSCIMQKIKGNLQHTDLNSIEKELAKLNHKLFMFFFGKSTLGFYEKLNFKLKLMTCDCLEYPFMLEIERETEREQDIKKHEKDILNFVEKYNLGNRLVSKEPPTLLFESLGKV